MLFNYHNILLLQLAPKISTHVKLNFAYLEKSEH